MKNGTSLRRDPRRVQMERIRLPTARDIIHHERAEYVWRPYYQHSNLLRKVLHQCSIQRRAYLISPQIQRLAGSFDLASAAVRVDTYTKAVYKRGGMPIQDTLAEIIGNVRPADFGIGWNV